MEKAALDALLMANAGATKNYKAEWEWDRYMVGGKMFAALCQPGEARAAAYAGHPLLTLKCDPLESESLQREFEDILPGFYMNKQNWLSIRLDGNVPDGMIERLCRQAYRLIFAKLTRKMQKEILEQAGEKWLTTAQERRVTDAPGRLPFPTKRQDTNSHSGNDNIQVYILRMHTNNRKA